MIVVAQFKEDKPMENTAQRTTHSRWASELEIKSSLCKVGQDGEDPPHGGIPLYADSGSVYVDPTDTHSLIVGATG
jgi:hypothetical protein